MIPLQTLCSYADALETNTHLKELHMANVRLTDKVAKVIVSCTHCSKNIIWPDV